MVIQWIVRETCVGYITVRRSKYGHFINILIQKNILNGHWECPLGIVFSSIVYLCSKEISYSMCRYEHELRPLSLRYTLGYNLLFPDSLHLIVHVWCNPLHWCHTHTCNALFECATYCYAICWHEFYGNDTHYNTSRGTEQGLSFVPGPGLTNFLWNKFQ